MCQSPVTITHLPLYFWSPQIIANCYKRERNGIEYSGFENVFRFWTLEGAPNHLPSRRCSGFYSEQKCVFSIFDFVGVVWRKYIFYQTFRLYEFNCNSYDIKYHIRYLFKIGFSYRNLWPGGHVLMMREAFLMVHLQHLNIYRDSEPGFWGWKT